MFDVTIRFETTSLDFTINEESVETVIDLLSSPNKTVSIHVGNDTYRVNTNKIIYTVVKRPELNYIKTEGAKSK